MGIDSILPARIGQATYGLFRYDQGRERRVAFPTRDADRAAAPFNATGSDRMIAANPRMTVNSMDRLPSSRASRWQTSIPSNALFYDEVDQISRGRREKGLLFDRVG